MAKFENRHLYIGGSDFGTVLGINPYKKRIELVLEKAQVLANTFEGNYATERGSRLEDKVIELFENETGLTVTDQQKTFERAKTKGCIKLLCHVDGMIGTSTIFEAKTTDIKSKTWNNGIPEYYVAQLEFNMFLAQCDKAYIAVAFCNGDEIVKFEYYEYLKQMTDKEILLECQKFTEDVEYYKQLGIINNGQIVEETIIDKDVQEYEELEQKIKDIKKQLKPLEDKKKIIEENWKKKIGQNYGISNDLYKIILGNRITSPSLEYKVSRSSLKVEYIK